MKTTYVPLLLVTGFVFCASAAETAHVRLFCSSVRFSEGTTGPGGDTLDLTSDVNLNEINGEVGPAFDPPVYFKLTDPSFPDPIAGSINFDTPDFVDNNGNGFDDFYEVSQAVTSTQTQGAFDTGGANGTVMATWSRAAGSATGTCVLQLAAQGIGNLLPFTHSFQVQEYTGTLSYTAASNGITGALALTQTQAQSNKLAGLVSFVRIATNKFNQLQLQAGTLTNAAGQTLTFSAAEIDRDTNEKTNYYGSIEFADGDPTTLTPDFLFWEISIDDTNDANGNGIPDLSDDPSAQPPPQGPGLTLTRSSGQLLLTVDGAKGQTYSLEETPSLLPATWQKASSITLTNSIQGVTLPVPSGQTAFWRLRSP
jgi:hypothetical protein